MLRHAVRLPIPTAADIARAWRELAKADAPLPAAADPPTPEMPMPEPSAPESTHTPAPTPAPAPESAPAPTPAPARIKRLYIKRLIGSREAARAIFEAGFVEQCRAKLEEELNTGPSSPSQWDPPGYANREA